MSMRELKTYPAFINFMKEVEGLRKEYNDRYKEARDLRAFGNCQGALGAIDKILELPDRIEEDEDIE